MFLFIFNTLTMLLLAIDCEMVRSTSRNLLARVSVVNQQGSVLLDEYVRPTGVVIDYMTGITGITKKDLDNGKSLSEVKSLVSKLLKGNVLVGHSLKNDLSCLGLFHPECNRRDLAKHERFMKTAKKQPQSLKVLAKKHLDKDIQNGVHNSVIDAQTAMELYLKEKNNNHWN